MDFTQTLTEGRLLRRYKRFLADIELANGEVVTAHTANTGSMTGCADPGSRVWLSRSDNPRRKLAHTWELVQTAAGTLVGINTMWPPRLVKEGIEQGIVNELQGYHNIRAEVRYGSENSRVDLLLEDQSGQQCYVEVKNVTAISEKGVALFPDAPSVRGQKHLRELMAVVTAGYRAVIFFVVQREDAVGVSPHVQVDPVYGQLLRDAIEQGVEAIAYQAAVSIKRVRLEKRLPVIID
jgi:sugar fermentation stimulation protein A